MARARPNPTRRYARLGTGLAVGAASVLVGLAAGNRSRQQKPVPSSDSRGGGAHPSRQSAGPPPPPPPRPRQTASTGPGRDGAERPRRHRYLRSAAMVAWGLAVVMGVPMFQGLEMLGNVGRPVQKPLRLNAGLLETSDITASLTKFRRGVFEVRPTPSPTPTPEEQEEQETVVAEAEPAQVAPASYSGSIAEIIRAAAAEYGLDGNYLLSVADCESGLNPQAHNPAGYYGLFQFSQSTWASHGYGSIYDPVAQSKTAARLIAAGHAGMWPNCA